MLHVDVHDGDGPPVVLVHGIMAGRGLWAANLDALRRVATPVVVELYGHGRSGVPDDDTAFTPAAYVAELERIRERLGRRGGPSSGSRWGPRSRCATPPTTRTG